MTVRYSTGLLKKMLGDSAVTAGSNGLAGCLKDGVIDIYTGGQPASADAAATGTWLGRVTQNHAAWTAGSATNGLEFDAPVGTVLSKAAAEVWSVVAAASGTAGWFRFRGNAADANTSGVDSLSTTLPRLDGAIGTLTGDLILSSPVFVSGSTPVTIDVFTVTLS